MSDIVTKDNERVISFFKSIDRMLDGLQNLVANHRPTLNGERYLTDYEVSQRLKTSRRTLQDWRNEGKISFILLGGKVLYPESAIQHVLDKHYRKAWE